MAATQSAHIVASIKIVRMKTVPRGVRLIAALEAAKAVLVLAAGFGLLKLLHHDVAAVVAHVITRLHLNPANKYPHIFIDAASHLTDAHLWSLAALALVYSIFRAVEAYGLWQDRGWAAWLAVGTGGIYLPIEIYELSHRLTWIRASALIVNLLVVLYMAYQIRRSKRLAQQAAA
jgi:uncharacterized membrane protein (DUF2068 family)